MENTRYGDDKSKSRDLSKRKFPYTLAVSINACINTFGINETWPQA